jgi:hypothetical protein
MSVSENEDRNVRCASSSRMIMGCTVQEKIKVCPRERYWTMHRESLPWSDALKCKLDKTGEDIPHLKGLALANTIKRIKRG